MLRKPRSPEDFAKIALMAEAFSKDARVGFNYDATLREFRAASENNDRLLLMSDNSFIYGVVHGWFGDPSYLIASEIALFVNPESRGKGLGKELIASYIDWAISKKARKITLAAHTGGDEMKASRLFEKTGFIKMETLFEMENYLWQ